MPGLSPVTFSDRARQVIQLRKHRVQSWFLDMGLVMAYWGGDAQRAYHHTAPVNALYGLHEALLVLQEEGLERAWARHRLHHGALAAGLTALGLEFVVPADWRLPQLNTMTIPAGVDDAAVRRQLLEEYSLEIGAGLGPLAGKVWRIGLMGYGANRRNVLTCLGALESVLSARGAKLTPGRAVTSAQEFYKAQLAPTAR